VAPTRQQTLDHARALAAARAERLLRVTAAIADAVTRDQVFEALVDQVAVAVGASTAALWLLEPGVGAARLVRTRGYSESAARQLDVLALDREPRVPAADAIRRAEPVWIASQEELFERYPHLRTMASPGRAYRIACLPLMTQGGVHGALALTIEDGADDTTDDEREFLLLVARYASQAVERLRLLEAERRSRAEATAAARRLQILNQASRVFADSSRDLQASLETVAVELATALESCINIGLVGGDGVVQIKAAHHPDPEAQAVLQALVPTTRFRVGEGITGVVAQTGASVTLSRIDSAMIAQRAVSSYKSFLERFPAYAMIGVALGVRGRVIGTLTASRVREGETYTSEDLALLEEIATRVAAAIEKSRLHEEAFEARTRAEELYQFAQTVVSASSVDLVYEAALQALGRSLKTERAAVLLIDADGLMRFKAWHSLSDEYRAAVEGHSPWASDAVAPQPVLVSDVSREPSLARFEVPFRREGIGALAFVPLVSNGQLIGKFMVYFATPHDFLAGEIETASALAHHLASVVARFTALAKLEETLRQNELFAGVLAHDLRNPLSAILSAAQLIARHEGRNEQFDRSVERIIASGRRMTMMISQLLDFTRARSGGGIEVDPSPADLGELLRQAVEELEVAHADWRVAQTIRGSTRGTWDAARLLQAVSNVVANAGQHGVHGGSISVRVDATLPERVQIEVHNDGAIPDHVLPQVFDPFGRTAQVRSHSPGLGLGLFIVREIVRAHGGVVRVRSSPADGTTVTLEIPRHARTVSKVANERVAESPAPRHAVLIVDDDPDTRDALAEMLREGGYGVDTAANGYDALVRVRSVGPLPSVILLDIHMPVMDGYGFLEERRSLAAVAAIPVIVVTGESDVGELQDVRAILSKPVDVTRLMSALRAALRPVL
jgi:signal transduction histidine kinase